VVSVIITLFYNKKLLLNSSNKFLGRLVNSQG